MDRVPRLRALLGRALGEFFDDRCPQMAAAIAYYGLFSLFPLAILAVGAFGIVIGEEQARRDVIDFVLDHIPLQPGQGRSDLRELLEGVTSGTAAFGAIGVAGLIFAASGLMGAIRSGVNTAFDTELRRPALLGKLVDVLLVTGVGVVVALSLALSLLADLIGTPGNWPLPFLVAVSLSFAVSAFLYRVLPVTDLRMRDVWPGALLAAVGYEAAKEGFALYLSGFGHYGAVYGSIGTVIAFMVFAFVAANVFLLGAQAASEWPGVRDADIADLKAGVPASERARQVLRGLVSRPER